MNNRLQTILETVAEIFEQGARESVSGHPLSFATASGTNKPAGPKAKGRERTRNVPPTAFGRGLNVKGNAGTEYGAVDKTGRPINKIAAYVPYMDETDFVGPLGTQGRNV